MIYTVPWHPDLDEEIPSYVMHALKQLDERINVDVGEPVELGFLIRHMRRDTGLSEETAHSIIALAAMLGMVNLATVVGPPR